MTISHLDLYRFKVQTTRLSIRVTKQKQGIIFGAELSRICYDLVDFQTWVGN